MAISRSENMRRIRSKNTSTELQVRQVLRSLGFTGYRIHYKNLPGKPDIVFVRRKKVILVHGCFWHDHDCKEGTRKPKSNKDYWLPKIAATKKRDADRLEVLKNEGWAALTVWECELRRKKELAEKLLNFLSA